MKRNYIVKKAGILLVAAVLILSAISVTANTNTVKTIKAQDPMPAAFDTLLSEGFEDGVMPPPGGWSTIDTSSTRNWGIVDAVTYPDFVHSGDYAAWVNYDSTVASDEWLISPDIDLIGYSSVTLTFWAESDTLYPGATMELHIRGAGFDDTIWDMIQDETWDTFEYREMTFDLSNYIGDTINISWRYVGLDGESFGLDDILVTAESGGDPLIADADGPYEADVGEPIQFQGDATGGDPPYSYEWDFGNGDTSDEEDPIYTYDEAGVYDVTLTVTDNAAATDDDATTATINEIPCCFEVEILPGFGIGLRAEVTEICNESHTGVPWEFKITGGIIVIPISPLTGTADFTAGETKIIKAPLVLGIGSIQITFTIDDCDPREVNALIIGPFVIVR